MGQETDINLCAIYFPYDICREFWDFYDGGPEMDLDQLALMSMEIIKQFMARVRKTPKKVHTLSEFRYLKKRGFTDVRLELMADDADNS